MSQPTYKFMASDAFAYVDTYRRLVMSTPGDITASRERLETRMSEMNLVPPRLYAELRAHEHAFNFVMKKQDPGMVVLGDQPAALDSAGPSPDEEARRRLEDELDQARKLLRQSSQRQQDLEAELVVRHQELGRLQRKLSQTYNSVAVGGVAVLLMVLAALALVWRH